jgi:hypothetical protein
MFPQNQCIQIYVIWRKIETFANRELNNGIYVSDDKKVVSDAAVKAAQKKISEKVWNYK